MFKFHFCNLMPVPPPTSQEKIEAMKKDFESGMKFSEIAVKHGVSEPTVRKYCKPKPEIPPETRDAIIECYTQEGMSAEQIAERYSTDVDVIEKIISAAGLSPAPEKKEEQPEKKEEQKEEKTPAEKPPPPPPPKEKTYTEKDILPQNIDKSLFKQAGKPTAKVLMDSAGEKGKDWAISCQTLGNFILDIFGPMAMRMDMETKEFVLFVYQFFLENYLKTAEKDELIAQLQEENAAMKEVIDEQILKLFVARSVDRVAVAAMVGGGTFDVDKLFEYQKMLLSTDVSYLKSREGIKQHEGINT